jgi:protocatechuate 3,4-dioxygenase beta subunit
VIDAVTGRPLAGAWIWPAEAPAAAVRSGEGGRFDLPPAAGRLPFVAALPGFVTTTWRPAAQGPTTVALQSAGSATGRVLAAGRAAGWVAVRLYLEGRPEPFLQAVAGPDGRFLFGGVPPKVPVELRALLDDARGVLAGTLSLVPLRPGEERRDLRLVLAPSAVVSGRIVDGGGRPLAGVALRLLPEERPATPLLRQTDPTSRAATAARSAADGRFELLARAAGRFRLDAERAGFVPRSVSGIALSGSARLELGDLMLDAAVALAGTVVDEQARPVVGATVEARAPATAVWRSRAATDGQGSFALAGLPAGEPLEVTVRHPDFVPARLADLAAPAEGVEVVLRAGAVLSGRVVDASGRGVPEAVVLASVTARPGEGTGAAAGPPEVDQRGVDPEGRFRFADLPAGTATVRASAPGYQPADRAGVEIDAAAPVGEEIELVLEPAAALAGVVRAPDGAPAAGARVTVLRPASAAPAAASAFADHGGGFRLDGLEPGPIEVMAEHDHWRSAVRSFDLALGENRVELILLPGLTVSGRIVDERGAPVAEAELAAAPVAPGTAPAGARLRTARSSADGSFEVRGLQPGRLELVARATGFVPVRAELALGEGSLAGIEVRLARGGSIHGRLLGLEPGELERLEVAAFSPQHGGAIGRAVSVQSYRVDGLAAGEWTVIASVPGGRQARATLHLEAGAEAEVDLDFEPGLRVTGRVH